MSKFLDVTLQEREDIVEEVYVKPKYDWRWENSVTSNKQHLDMEGLVEFKYDAFRLNRTLSNYIDTISVADDLNRNYHLDFKLQYDYAFYKIKKGKRWFKRPDKDKNADLALIREHYKYNIERAKEVLRILSPEQLQIIRKEKEKGG